MRKEFRKVCIKLTLKSSISLNDYYKKEQNICIRGSTLKGDLRKHLKSKSKFTILNNNLFNCIYFSDLNLNMEQKTNIEKRLFCKIDKFTGGASQIFSEEFLLKGAYFLGHILIPTEINVDSLEERLIFNSLTQIKKINYQTKVKIEIIY